MKGTFGQIARSYWERDLSPLPIRRGTKQPAIMKWSGYCHKPPKLETRMQWERAYEKEGTGLCLGTLLPNGFLLAAVDVDSNAHVEVTRLILGKCPCAKKGKKGITFFVRAERGLKSTSFRLSDKTAGVDILAAGRQTVVPPTLHPETKAPYVWVGQPLLEMDFGELPFLDAGKLKILKIVFSTEQALTLVAGTVTHEAGVQLAAKLVAAGCEDELITGIFINLLPQGYRGNSLEELPEWIASAREKGFGDRPQSGRTNAADRLIAYFERSGGLLFHDEAKRGFMSVKIAGGTRHLPIDSSEGRDWLTKLQFDNEKSAIDGRALDQACRLLEARARFEAPLCKTFLRVGGNANRISIDLGHENGLQVSITADGWQTTLDSAVKFIRSAGFGYLPAPIRGGNIRRFRELIAPDEQSWALTLAYLLCCTRPGGPFMLLLVEGEQGSGKSFFCKLIKRIIDPNQVEKSRLPESERDLMIHAQDYHLLSFDNVSGMKADLSDALCVLSTGGGFATRKLYTNNDLFVFNQCRPIMINGIADFVTRPDLLERAIPLRLPSIPEHKRRTEEEMLAEFESALPEFLGYLYEVIAGGLRNLPETKPPTKLRMADAARWLVACEPLTGLPAGSFLSAIASTQNETFIERAQNDTVVAMLLGLFSDREFQGSAHQLLMKLHERDPDRNGRSLPPTPQHLSKHLARLKPAMAKMGLHVEWLPRTSEGRLIRIWREGAEKPPKKQTKRKSEKPPYF